MSETQTRVDSVLQVAYHQDQKNERVASRTLMVFIEDELRVRELSVVDELLAKIDVNKLSQYSLVGVIRCTYRVRSLVKSWDTLYKAVRYKAESNGDDTAKLFLGLP